MPEILVDRLAVLTGRINREIAVYINRKGRITDVSVGDSSGATLSEVAGRRGSARLSGIRCIHTHPNGEGVLSAVDINSLLKLNLDAMIAIGIKGGEAAEIYAALPSAGEIGRQDRADIYGPFERKSPDINSLFKLVYERDRVVSDTSATGAGREEKAILVGLEMNSGRIINGKNESERSLDELEELSLTAGLTVLEKILQKRPARDAAFYIGRGKVEQLSLMVQELDADVMVFDDELSGAQIRNIEGLTGAKVIDRTTLILDIFAQRAQSSEGKLQVELAQLKYRLPRLTGLGGQLSRLGGGIGTRGPGEKKLEIDRRHIRKRISSLDSELERVDKRRGLLREGRRQNSVPVIALVGYTNSGKSTLMNRLCNTDVFAEDKLFATLDPTTRKLVLPDGANALLVDTVGFIRKLPHELVEAFKSTLEEVLFADLLLHIVDASDDEAVEHIPVAEGILRDLGAFNKPALMVLNKMDLVKSTERLPMVNSEGGVHEISAVTGQGLDGLLACIAAKIRVEEEVDVKAPYSEGWIVPYIHENGTVITEEYTENGVSIKAKISRARLEKIRDFVI